LQTYFTKLVFATCTTFLICCACCYYNTKNKLCNKYFLLLTCFYCTVFAAHACIIHANTRCVRVVCKIIVKNCNTSHPLRTVRSEMLVCTKTQHAVCVLCSVCLLMQTHFACNSYVAAVLAAAAVLQTQRRRRQAPPARFVL
jgi:hypothetical protein